MTVPYVVLLSALATCGAASIKAHTYAEGIPLVSSTDVEECQAPEDPTTGKRMRISPGGDSSERMDAVITWFTDTPQSEMRSQSLPTTLGKRSSVLEVAAGNKLTIDNNAEIKYLLRSLEQKGLFKKILRNVYILMDAQALAKYGAPRFFRYGQSEKLDDGSGTTVEHQIFVVSDKTVVPESEELKPDAQEAKDPDLVWYKYDRRIRNMNRIPGLSRYFLLLPDDVLFVGGPSELKADWLFTASSKTQDSDSFATPTLYSAGDYKFADCMGREGIGQGHGPAVIDRCVWERLAKNIWSPRSASIRGEKQPTAHSKYGFETVCLYHHAMTESFGATGVPYFHNFGMGGISPNHKNEVSFYAECHTNGGCGTGKEAGTIPSTVVVNLQGNSVSDEYGGKHAPEAQAWKQFYHEKFPERGMFEVVGGEGQLRGYDKKAAPTPPYKKSPEVISHSFVFVGGEGQLHGYDKKAAPTPPYKKSPEVISPAFVFGPLALATAIFTCSKVLFEQTDEHRGDARAQKIRDSHAKESSCGYSSSSSSSSSSTEGAL